MIKRGEVYMFEDFTDKRGRVWEWFIDASYYYMFCVRLKEDKDWNSEVCFHFTTSVITKRFVESLKESC